MGMSNKDIKAILLGAKGKTLDDALIEKLLASSVKTKVGESFIEDGSLVKRCFYGDVFWCETESIKLLNFFGVKKSAKSGLGDSCKSCTNRVVKLKKVKEGLLLELKKSSSIDWVKYDFLSSKKWYVEKIKEGGGCLELKASKALDYETKILVKSKEEKSKVK